ncbi:hypothetical protein IM697_24175 [Streptomyces ferrugineus]|uniref:Vegetative cell wall protein gp1 n=1 Tax=Streptomyces ferrugineus TaxID=1413221 RepID=A0A7M2SAL1_9ACTN|nr:hypothetical protein [Streptomyces ferrugineus]QOV33324.1 hypothetical protein IM697_24175 [Streptomyces ferrugineus]
MGGFLDQLAKTLADRWVSLLVLPGAFFLGTAWLSVGLGHAEAWNVPLLTRRTEDAAATVADLPAGAQALLVVAVLAAAAGVGFVVQALAGVTRRVWLGQWPRPLDPVAVARTARRRARWHQLVEERRTLERATPGTRTREQQDQIDTVAERITRLAMAEPGRPTWMGDRIHAVESIAYHRYGLDLAYGWSRLWLVLPDPARAELTAAHSAFAAAVATGTWAVPYLLLTAVWWPAVLVAAGIGLTGWVRARAAMADLTTLTEAVLDLHGRTLGAALGVGDPTEETGPLTIGEGERITDLVRKGR